jgi:hypothetical protein
MMKDSVQTFNSWDRDIAFLSHLQWSSEISFNLHGSLGFKVEPHSTVVLLWEQHFLQGRFPIVGWKIAVLCFGKS